MRSNVAEGEWLYRRGYSTPERRYMNPDGTATSRVFALREKDKGELSVDVKSLTTPEVSVMDPNKYMIFEIAHRHVQELGLHAEHDPIADGQGIEINLAHAVILGMDIKDDITPGLLAGASRRVSI
jgi:hypothetical protein